MVYKRSLRNDRQPQRLMGLRSNGPEQRHIRAIRSNPRSTRVEKDRRLDTKEIGHILGLGRRGVRPHGINRIC